MTPEKLAELRALAAIVYADIADPTPEGFATVTFAASAYGHVLGTPGEVIGEIDGRDAGIVEFWEDLFRELAESHARQRAGRASLEE